MKHVIKVLLLFLLFMTNLEARKEHSNHKTKMISLCGRKHQFVCIGATGPAGPTGATGPCCIGPIGSTGALVTSMISTYGNSQPIVSAMPVTVTFPVANDRNLQAGAGGIQHSPDDTFTILDNGGVYLVNWSLIFITPSFSILGDILGALAIDNNIVNPQPQAKQNINTMGSFGITITGSLLIRLNHNQTLKLFFEPDGFIAGPDNRFIENAMISIVKVSD